MKLVLEILGCTLAGCAIAGGLCLLGGFIWIVWMQATGQNPFQ